MPHRHHTRAFAVLSLIFTTMVATAAPPPAELVVPVLKELCVDCHGEKKKKGKFALHDISPNIAGGKDIERWEKILEMVSIGDMPPEDEPQPTDEQRKFLVDWISSELENIGRGPTASANAGPHFGNRVNHEDLFNGEHKGPAYTSSRLWRISPSIYSRFASNMQMARKLRLPLQTASGKGFQDYSLLYADEATIKSLIQNGRRTATTLLEGTMSRGMRGNKALALSKSTGKKVIPKQGGRAGSKHKIFTAFISAKSAPKRDEMEAVLNYSFNLLLNRSANDEEQNHYIDGLFQPCIDLGGRKIGMERLLSAIMMSPEFLFRMELGLGKELPDGRRMLSPRELAYALSFSIFDYLDPQMLKAAEEGKLETKEDIAREFRRMLDGPDRKVRGPANKKFWVINKGAGIEEVKLLDASHPRLLRFFREFFGYTRAPGVFKDGSRSDGKYNPYELVQDADWFVLRALKDDQQVFEKLLTGDSFFVKSNSGKAIKDAYSYNIDSPKPPIEAKGKSLKMEQGQRSGILTHPAWLAAHSGNFENDPVRRGKWIQEHLLAGIVPDVPIGVEAQLPEEPHRTLRQRFEIVEAEQCWRCHKKMNPLGNPFEAYDDFGRYREQHLIGADGNVIASKSEAFSKVRTGIWKKSHPDNPTEKFKQILVDTSGEIKGTGDSSLDGPVSGPLELTQKLAKSDRVRQSIIRHVFRFWVGRNETLDDSPTLMAMDKAYLDNDGSFSEVLVSLVTSDSFIYRKTQ